MSLVVDHLPDSGVTRVSRWIFNCYVIHGEQGPVIVDAGLPSAATDLAPVLDALPGRPQAVLATHGHSDHVAGAPSLAARYGVPIHLPARTFDYLAGERPRTPRPTSIAGILPTLRDQPLDRTGVAGFVRGARIAGYGLPGGMRWTGPRPAGPLAGDTPVPALPDWTVLAAPGHTDDSIALWHPSSGTLLTGDAILTARDRAYLPSDAVDHPRATATFDTLRRLPVRHLLPGHGRPAHTPNIW